MRTRAKHGHEPVSNRGGTIFALYGAMTLTAILISAGRADVDIYRIESVSTSRWLLLSPVIGLLIGLGVVALSRVSVRRYEWARNLHRDFGEILGHLGTGEILLLAVASAVGEELMFRGALQPWIGLWPQAIVFALLHVGPGKRFLPWTLSALAVGIGFGYLVEATGDLGAPIVAHFTINYLNLRFITRVKLPARTRPLTAPGLALEVDAVERAS